MLVVRLYVKCILSFDFTAKPFSISFHFTLSQCVENAIFFGVSLSIVTNGPFNYSTIVINNAFVLIASTKTVPLNLAGSSATSKENSIFYFLNTLRQIGITLYTARLWSARIDAILILCPHLLFGRCHETCSTQWIPANYCGSFYLIFFCFFSGDFNLF